MFQVAKKDIKVGINEQVVSPACTCAEYIHERLWMFENNDEHQNLWVCSKGGESGRQTQTDERGEGGDKENEGWEPQIRWEQQ